jgi:hypothetical protein
MLCRSLHKRCAGSQLSCDGILADRVSAIGLAGRFRVEPLAGPTQISLLGHIDLAAVRMPANSK